MMKMNGDLNLQKKVNVILKSSKAMRNFILMMVMMISN